MSNSTWTGAVSNDWNDKDNWNPIGVPGVNSDVTIATGRAVASASIGTVSSITDSSGLRFRSAGRNTVATFLDNSGELRVDRKGGGGGTILNIEGKLTNSGSLRIGNATLSASDTVSAASLDNTGDIRLLGSGANQALLDVTGSAGFGAAGVLSGDVRLTRDSAIEFTSGQITSLAAGAQLHLNGSDAFIEDSSALGSNSALTGLASIGAGAYFELENGASVSTTGALVNDGFIELDVNAGDGGSSLTVGGALTNHVGLVIGNARLSASDKVMAASLNNNTIGLTGSFTGANQALLDVTGSAGFGTAGVLTGEVTLAGDSAIEFASGEITSLAQYAILTLDGNDAFIEDSTALGSNSALTGLASIGANAIFGLTNGASVSTTGALTNNGSIGFQGGSGEGGEGSSLTVAGALTNSGSIGIDRGDFGPGGSTLSVGGALTNSGTLYIGGTSSLSSSKVAATALTNTGSISVANGALDVSGATTNNGSISIGTGAATLAGAVGGAGSFSLVAANLQFDSSVSAGQTITAAVTRVPVLEALVLEQAQNFAATINGFDAGDTIDAANFLLSGTSFKFVENSANTGGTLTLHDGSLTANILMTGVYKNSDFSLAHDSGTGTLVKFV